MRRSDEVEGQQRRGAAAAGQADQGQRRPGAPSRAREREAAVAPAGSSAQASSGRPRRSSRTAAADVQPDRRPSSRGGVSRKSWIASRSGASCRIWRAVRPTRVHVRAPPRRRAGAGTASRSVAAPAGSPRSGRRAGRSRCLRSASSPRCCVHARRRSRSAGSGAPGSRLPSRSVAGASITSGAKCTPSSAPKSSTEPFATPSPIVSSRLSSVVARAGADRRDDRQRALVRHRDARLRPANLSEKWRILSSLPVHEPEVDARRDLADLVAHPLREERRLRVVEDDRLLAVEPARLLVDLRPHGIEAERAGSCSGARPSRGRRPCPARRASG